MILPGKRLRYYPQSERQRMSTDLETKYDENEALRNSEARVRVSDFVPVSMPHLLRPR